MKKVLFAVMAIVLAVGLMGSAFAYFTSTIASTGNVLTAGKIILDMSNGGAYQQGPVVIATAANLAPGTPTGIYTAGFENDPTSTLNGYVTATVSYDRTISGADAYAAQLEVVSNVTNGSGGNNVVGYWAEQICDTAAMTFAQGAAAQLVAVDPNTGDGNTFGYVPTLYGLQTVVLHFSPYEGPATFSDAILAPTGSEWLQMKLELNPLAGNQFQGNSLSFTITGTITAK